MCKSDLHILYSFTNLQMKKIIILFFCFYFFALLQASFLPHFPIGHLLNFVLIIVVLINLFEAREEKFGFFGALIGGFFLDIFSERLLGFHILTLLLLAFLIKMVLKRYIQLPVFLNAKLQR